MVPGGLGSTGPRIMEMGFGIGPEGRGKKGETVDEEWKRRNCYGGRLAK